jgi:hypothetical protein
LRQQPELVELILTNVIFNGVNGNNRNILVKRITPIKAYAKSYASVFTYKIAQKVKMQDRQIAGNSCAH